MRFNQTLQNYLKVSVGNDSYNLTKYDKIQITDTTKIKFPNIRSDLLQKCNIKCKNKNNDSKVGNFLKSTRTNSPTGESGATTLPPIGNSFMYVETSSNNHVSVKFFFLLKDQTSFKLVISLSIITDFQFQLMIRKNQWVGLEFSYY